MPPTDSQRARLRMMIGDSNPDLEAFSDAELDALWDWAAETYSAANLIFVQTKIYAFDALLVDSAKRVNYKQNQSSEDLSDIFKALLKLKEKAENELAELVAGSVSPMMLGTIRKVKPTRKKNIPGS